MYHSVKLVSFFENDPDDVAKKFKNFNCVVYDSPETEKLYSKSFHLYASGALQVLDLIELSSVVDIRRQSFLQHRSHLDAAKAEIQMDVN